MTSHWVDVDLVNLSYQESNAFASLGHCQQETHLPIIQLPLVFDEVGLCSDTNAGSSRVRECRHWKQQQSSFGLICYAYFAYLLLAHLVRLMAGFPAIHVAPVATSASAA
jgi:hypothetical protein